MTQKRAIGKDARPSWVDMPGVEAISNIKGLGDTSDLRDMLERYHNIPKDKLETLSLRYDALMKLAEYCDKKSVIVSNGSLYAGFSHRAHAKGNYLLELKK